MAARGSKAASGLPILALGAQNVTAQSAADPSLAPRFRTFGTDNARAEVARRLIEGGHLTSDVDVLREAARDMLVQVLSCRVGTSQSGVVARVAGEAIGADRFLPSMADGFLEMLSKGGIEKTVRELGLTPRNTGKEMRVALLQHIGQNRYVLPAAYLSCRRRS